MGDEDWWEVETVVGQKRRPVVWTREERPREGPLAEGTSLGSRGP